MLLSPSANLEQDPFYYLTLYFPSSGDLKFYWVYEISQLVLGAAQMHLGLGRFREVAYWPIGLLLVFFFFFAIAVSSCCLLLPRSWSPVFWALFCDSCHFDFVNVIFMFDRTAVCYLKQQIYGKLKMNINKNPINFLCNIYIYKIDVLKFLWHYSRTIFT